MVCAKNFHRENASKNLLTYQNGQALIFGLFILLGGIATLFFLFNTSQLSQEKTKLVNTSDVVAYSAGVIHARALNYIAYTNRALVANEVTIAQAVSLSSWAQFLTAHGESTGSLGCGTETPLPGFNGLILYTPTCAGLFFINESPVLPANQVVISKLAQFAVTASEVSKLAIQLAQDVMIAELPLIRDKVIKEVAEANYENDGEISVDTVPLLDTFYNFEGAPIISHYTKKGDERKRFAELALESAQKDEFVRNRQWEDHGIVPTCLPISLDTNYVTRDGETKLIGYDEWRANDSATYVFRYIGFHGFLNAIPQCDSQPYSLGTGSQSANSSPSGSFSSSDFQYSGIPSFYDLSEAALGYTPENSDLQKRDPKIQFAIRIKRSPDQTKTSEGTSAIRNTVRLNDYKGEPAGSVYASVSGAEVYFARPQEREDGNRELASLFNPYWQVRLLDVKKQVLAAQLLQGASIP
jgi:hypothetical protein